jgi:hypothetical protein
VYCGLRTIGLDLRECCRSNFFVGDPHREILTA